MFRFKSVVLVVFFILIHSLNASSFKKYAGEFLYVAGGARGTAMGGAFTALANDVSSVYWNPAGLIEAEGLQVQFMHSRLYINSIENNSIIASTPFTENSSIGFSLSYLTVNDIKDSRNAYNIIEGRVDPSRVKLFNTGDYVFTASYAQKYNEQINWGINVKLIYRDFEIENATGIGFDAAVKYTLDDLKLALVLRDFTSTMIAWSTNEKQFVVPSARFGAAYTFDFPSIYLKMTPAVDMNILAEKRDYAAQINAGIFSADLLAGLEAAYYDLVTVRFGIDDLQRMNTGIGLSLPRVNIDYAFTFFDSDLGNIQRISFHLLLGDVLK
jgi:Uncharacterised protein family (UPF0164)